MFEPYNGDYANTIVLVKHMIRKILLLLVVLFFAGSCLPWPFARGYDHYDDVVRKTDNDYVVVVDYDLPIFVDRFFVFNSRTKKLEFSSMVGHAYRSGVIKPRFFSNEKGSNRTSYGTYKVGKNYYGKFGKSVKLHGLENTNSNAYNRAIVVHKASYGKYGVLYSHGCFTFLEKDYSEVLKYLTPGRRMIVLR